MKTYRSLAWRELRAQKVTSFLVLIAVILSTLMTTAVGQSIGILQAMREEQARNLNGNRYATFHQLTEPQVDLLWKDSRLSYAEPMISLGVSDIPGSKISILLREYLGNSLTAYPDDFQLQEGRLPKHPHELALSSDVLSLLQFDGVIGDTITLPIRVSLMRDTEVAFEYSCDFRLTGILKSNYIGYVTGSAAGIVGSGTSAQILPQRYHLYSVDIRTADKKAFQSIVDDLAQTLAIPDYCIQYNDTLLSASGIPYDTGTEESMGDNSGFSYVILAGLCTGFLVLLAAGLVIYNILKLSVASRSRNFGILRAMGAGRGQLYWLVALQLLLLCCIGIPSGALLGLLSAKGITTAAAGFFNPELFLASSQDQVSNMIAANASGKWTPLFISAAITVLFAFAAAMPAAIYASTVSPVSAIGGQRMRIRRRNRKAKRIHHFESFYARMNMRRSPGRTAITVVSLAMSITVFVALNSFSGLLDTSASIQGMHLGDYSMTSLAAGFSDDDVEKLKGISGVQAVSTVKFHLYEADESGNFSGINLSFDPQPGETVQVIGLDAERLAATCPDLSPQQLQSLLEGSLCLVKNPISISFQGWEMQNTALAAGESISVNNIPLPIAALLDTPITLDNEGFINGIQIVGSNALHDSLTGLNRYAELYPTLDEGADRSAVESVIREICQQAGGTWFSYENTDRQLAESYQQIRLLSWALILLIGLIGILNIVNTVYTNIHTRIAEIGIQRAIGMSSESLYRTFLWEAAYYGLIASAVGGLCGYLSTILISSAATDRLALTAVPVLTIAQATFFAIAACLVATVIPLRKIAKMDIVSSIETVD